MYRRFTSSGIVCREESRLFSFYLNLHGWSGVFILLSVATMMMITRVLNGTVLKTSIDLNTVLVSTHIFEDF